MFLAAISGLALSHTTQTLAASTTKFIIDPSQSYVEAYVFNGWVSDGYPWNSGVYWSVDWALQSFELSGSFTVETTSSGSNPAWNHLTVVKNEVVTNAPVYASFSLPFFYSTYGDSVSYSSHPCFDIGFYDPPGQSSSCSGGQIGQTRSDEGTLIAGKLDITGAISDSMSLWGPKTYGISLPSGITPNPQLAVDYSYVEGLFKYHIVAVTAVPEPEISLMMLMGLGLLSIAIRHRKSGVSLKTNPATTR